MKIKEKHDLEFFWVCFKIGLGALVYRIGIDVFSTVAIFISIFIAFFFPENEALINVITNLNMGISSIAAFVLGASVIWCGLHIGKLKNYQKIHKRTGVSFTAPLIIVAVVAINLVVAELNAYIMSFISADSIVNVPVQPVSGTSLMEILALLFSTAIVPAICEEIAFRGLILTNLESYGKGSAIFGSALLFGLMHMNPAQFLYTTALGLLIGLVYVKTRSIWLCIIIHFVNNGIVVVQQIMYYTIEERLADKLISAMTLSIIFLGIVAMTILAVVYRQKRKNAPEEIGCFGRIHDAGIEYADRPVTKSRKVLLFFSSTITVFTVMIFAAMATSVIFSFFGLI